MTLADYCELSGDVDIKDEVVLACSYLQAKGFQFSEGMDLDNACALAEELYRAECGVKP